jgi:leucyl-tRNA synthetase
MTDRYNPREIEKKWQQRWAADRLYEVRDDDPRPKYYALTMFPYTSGDLHIGHWYNNVPIDAFARYMRMRGFNVLHPMGFDAFGLPAENAAIEHGIHPYKWTMANIEKMRRQLKSIGAVYDWSREVITCLPEYYKWTQWFFLKLYKAGLAYRARAPVNWCPHCQTVLANEQVVGEGVCERCDTPVIKRDLEQWFFRITRYADELLNFDGIDWPERIKIMQRNWIGKSYGTEISFGLDHPGVDEKEIRVFTTRPDTVFGVTFMVLAPEHPLVTKLTTPDKKAEVEAYIMKSRRQSEIERLSTEKEKDGVFTGAYCTNRLNGTRVPIWIADYVLLSYGTGAVMAVPAHDGRDFAFARKYDLPIPVVIAPPEWDGDELKEAYTEPGTMVNSGRFDGLPSQRGIGAVSTFLEEKGWGKRTVSYKIRDWLISRQRYWGAPIPMVHCQKCGIVPVPEKDLPVLLPEDAEFKPTGESPLKYNGKFVSTTCPRCHNPAQRETDTMDTFMCSSWYYLRYCSPHDASAAFDAARVKLWCPVNFYTGGAEHAVMHLLYVRFFAKAIRDMGLVDFDEPFLKLFNQGVIILNQAKMSKSRGNVVNPDAYVADLGADTVRAYLMFIGPWDQGGEWNDSGISGISRWLKRAWSLAVDGYVSRGVSGDDDLVRLVHQTIKRVTEDIEKLRFNVMVAALMEFTNYLGKVKESGSASEAAWQDAIKTLLLLLAPTAPHIAEELWRQTGREYSVHRQGWPGWDESIIKREEIVIPVQINGKLRDIVTVSASLARSIKDAELPQLMKETSSRIAGYLKGKEIIKIIHVREKIVNFIVK